VPRPTLMVGLTIGLGLVLGFVVLSGEWLSYASLPLVGGRVASRAETLAHHPSKSCRSWSRRGSPIRHGSTL